MESIIFFKYDSALQLIRTHSVDSMAILPFLEGRDFKITSVHSLEDGVRSDQSACSKLFLCWSVTSKQSQFQTFNHNPLLQIWSITFCQNVCGIFWKRKYLWTIIHAEVFSCFRYRHFCPLRGWIACACIRARTRCPIAPLNAPLNTSFLLFSYYFKIFLHFVLYFKLNWKNVVGGTIKTNQTPNKPTNKPQIQTCPPTPNTHL